MAFSKLARVSALATTLHDNGFDDVAAAVPPAKDHTIEQLLAAVYKGGSASLVSNSVQAMPLIVKARCCSYSSHRNESSLHISWSCAFFKTSLGRASGVPIGTSTAICMVLTKAAHITSEFSSSHFPPSPGSAFSSVLFSF